MVHALSPFSCGKALMDPNPSCWPGDAGLPDPWMDRAETYCEGVGKKLCSVLAIDCSAFCNQRPCPGIAQISSDSSLIRGTARDRNLYTEAGE
jgi:hypothetical protein